MHSAKTVILIAIAFICIGCKVPTYIAPNLPEQNLATIFIENDSSIPSSIHLFEDPILCNGLIAPRITNDNPNETCQAGEVIKIVVERGKPFGVFNSYLQTSLPTITTLPMILTMIPTDKEYKLIFMAKSENREIQTGNFKIFVKVNGVWSQSNKIKFVNRKYTQPFLQTGPWAEQMTQEELKTLDIRSISK